MFGPLGFPELIFLLVLALLIFGPKKLPEIGRTLGKGLAELRRASNELKRTIDSEMEDVREMDPRRLLREEAPRRKPAQRAEPQTEVRAESATEPAASGPEAGADDGRVARGTAAAQSVAEPAAAESSPAESSPAEATPTAAVTP